MKIIKHNIFFVLFCTAAVAARAQSTAFTYQGRLAANGSPYTGFAEMQFALFNAPTGGVAVANNSPAIAGVNVNGGLFTVSLDFGAGAFPGADRFLEIQVRTNLGAFSTLTPRQPVTPTPYALYAISAGPWSPNGTDISYTGGKVGIGTATPAAGLHVKKEAIPPGGTLALEGDTHTYMTFFPDGVAAGRKGYLGFPSSNTTDMTLANEYPGGRIVLFDHSGALFPTAGEENLRIVRGTIDTADGSIITGSGFSVSRVGAGTVIITFTTPFAGRPTVTAIAQRRGCDPYPMTDGVSASSVKIVVTCDVGDANWPFDFIAVGPR